LHFSCDSAKAGLGQSCQMPSESVCTFAVAAVRQGSELPMTVSAESFVFGCPNISRLHSIPSECVKPERANTDVKVCGFPEGGECAFGVSRTPPIESQDYCIQGTVCAVDHDDDDDLYRCRRRCHVSSDCNSLHATLLKFEKDQCNVVSEEVIAECHHQRVCTRVVAPGALCHPKHSHCKDESDCLPHAIFDSSGNVVEVRTTCSSVPDFDALPKDASGTCQPVFYGRSNGSMPALYLQPPRDVALETVCEQGGLSEKTFKVIQPTLVSSTCLLRRGELCGLANGTKRDFCEAGSKCVLNGDTPKCSSGSPAPSPAVRVMAPNTLLKLGMLIVMGCRSR